jgi:DNA-binding NarL/FixJ family response regulator
MRVLIVDDDPKFREAAAAAVEAEGHAVVGLAVNGREGLALAFELRPDLILMDLDMPVLSGVDATRQIVKALHETRVVVISGSEVEAHILGAYAAGAVAYIPKSEFGERLPDVLQGLVQDADG